MRLRRALAAVLCLVALVASGTAPAAAQPCEFTLGFAFLHGQIPDTVGVCTEPPRLDPVAGTITQPTTRGLLIRRNITTWPYFWVSFTDGTTTWLFGPEGLQSRPNTTAFPWESQLQPQVPLPATAAPYQGYLGPYDPYFPQRTCADFASQQQAQGFFVAAGGPKVDRHGLDPDGDGFACLETRAPAAPPGPPGPSGPVLPPPPPLGFNPRLYVGQGDRYDCSDFGSQAEAQAVLMADLSDPNKLDTDVNGIACDAGEP